MSLIKLEAQRSETLVCRTSCWCVLLIHLTGQVLHGGNQVGCDIFYFCVMQLYCPGQVAVVVHQVVVVAAQLGQVSSHFTQAPQKFLLLLAVVLPPFNHWVSRGENRQTAISSYTVLTQTFAIFKELTEGYHDNDCSQEDEPKQTQQNLHACSRTTADWSGCDTRFPSFM